MSSVEAFLNVLSVVVSNWPAILPTRTSSEVLSVGEVKVSDQAAAEAPSGAGVPETMNEGITEKGVRENSEPPRHRICVVLFSAKQE